MDLKVRFIVEKKYSKYFCISISYLVVGGMTSVILLQQRGVYYATGCPKKNSALAPL